MRYNAIVCLSILLTISMISHTMYEAAEEDAAAAGHDVQSGLPGGARQVRQLVHPTKSIHVTPPAHANTGTDRQPAVMAIPFDAKKYQRDIQALQKKRNAQDEVIRQQQADEDISAQRQRNEQGFFTRLVHSASDVATDEEIQKKRNDEAMQRNAQRIAEDFELQRQRFEDFKTAYPDFAKIAPFDTLLKFGDMNEFINANKQSRDARITELKDALANLDERQISEGHEQALLDFSELVNLGKPRPAPAGFVKTVAAEFDSQSASAQETMIQQLKKTLMVTLDESLQKLQTFSDALETVKADIASVRKLRTIKEIGNAVGMIAGTAAIVSMVTNPAGLLVIHGIALSMEKLTALAKVGLGVGHAGAHIESKAVLQTQQKMVSIFKEILPQSFRMIEPTEYHNKARTLGDRIADTTVGKAARKVRATLQPATDVVKSAANKVGAAVGRVTESITQTQAYKTVAEKASTVARQIGKAVPTLQAPEVSAKDWAEFSLARQEFAKAPDLATQQPEDDPESAFETLQQERVRRAAQRQEDDETLQKYRTDTAQFAAKHRDQQGFFTRLLNKLVSDSDSDAQQQLSENDALMARNARRLRDEFEQRKTQYEAFKNAHVDFARTEPWKSILDIGDVNSFISMDFAARTQKIAELQEALDQAFTKGTIPEQFQKAAYELVQLTSFAQTNTIPEGFTKSFEAKIQSLTDEQKNNLHAQVIAELRKNMNVSVQQLKNFSIRFEAVKSDIATLQTLQTVQDISNAITVIAGTAALVAMIAGPSATLAIHGITITVGKLAIVSKAGYIAGATTGSIQKALTLNIQKNMVAIFQGLMPDGFTLETPTEYENKARSLTQRIIGDKAYHAAAKKLSGVKDRIAKNFATKTDTPPKSAPANPAAPSTDVTDADLDRYSLRQIPHTSRATEV